VFSTGFRLRDLLLAFGSIVSLELYAHKLPYDYGLVIKLCSGLVIFTLFTLRVSFLQICETTQPGALCDSDQPTPPLPSDQ